MHLCVGVRGRAGVASECVCVCVCVLSGVYVYVPTSQIPSHPSLHTRYCYRAPTGADPLSTHSFTPAPLQQLISCQPMLLSLQALTRMGRRRQSWTNCCRAWTRACWSPARKRWRLSSAAWGSAAAAAGGLGGASCKRAVRADGVQLGGGPETACARPTGQALGLRQRRLAAVLPAHRCATRSSCWQRACQGQPQAALPARPPGAAAAAVGPGIGQGQQRRGPGGACAT